MYLNISNLNLVAIDEIVKYLFALLARTVLLMIKQPCKRTLQLSLNNMRCNNSNSEKLTKIIVLPLKL